MLIPSLTTERLELIPPSLSCQHLYNTFYMDAHASEMYGGPLTEEQTFGRLKADIGSWYLLGFGIWIIKRKSDQKLLGTCGFWQGANWPRELTWWLLPEARGTGFAQEASKAAIRYAYEHFEWQVVETYMNDENDAARKLVERLGGIKNRRELFPDKFSRDIYQIPFSED